jgi:hypothetical protein
MRRLVSGAIACIASTTANAVDCNDLKPIPPKDSTTSFTGKLDASVDGFFAKLASVGTKVEGTYTDVATNVLKDLPQADKLYMWERVLFLECQLIADAKDLPSAQKIQIVGELYSKFNQPPPAIAANSSPNTNNSNNTATNTGSNSTIIQGSGNNVGK